MAHFSGLVIDHRTAILMKTKPNTVLLEAQETDTMAHEPKLGFRKKIRGLVGRRSKGELKGKARSDEVEEPAVGVGSVSKASGKPSKKHVDQAKKPTVDKDAVTEELIVHSESRAEDAKKSVVENAAGADSGLDKVSATLDTFKPLMDRLGVLLEITDKIGEVVCSAIVIVKENLTRSDTSVLEDGNNDPLCDSEGKKSGINSKHLLIPLM